VSALLGDAFGHRDLHTSALPDFSLWGFLKETVYSNSSRSLEELKHNIEQTVANTDQEALRKVARNPLELVDLCLQEAAL
jgi:hypothetical protein